MEAPLPINFANQVVPIFTKLGCNSGGCHGKIAGQNGFRLSLLGFDPTFDYDNLLKEGRGRRVFPAAPDASLLLTKASGAVAHGGGKKMDAGGEEYKIVRRWIASGMPYGEPTDPTVDEDQRLPRKPRHRSQGTAATRGATPTTRTARRRRDPPGAVREQRHRRRHRERSGPGQHATASPGRPRSWSASAAT